jgi:hypothetical protein
MISSGIFIAWPQLPHFEISLSVISGKMTSWQPGHVTCTEMIGRCTCIAVLIARASSR